MQVELDTSYSVTAKVKILAVDGKAKLVIDGHPVTVDRNGVNLNLHFDISPQTRAAEPVSYEIEREDRDG